MDFFSWKFDIEGNRGWKLTVQSTFFGGRGRLFIGYVFSRLEAMRNVWMLFLEHLHGFCWNRPTGKWPSLKLKQQLRLQKKERQLPPPKREQDCPNNSIFQRRTCQYCIGSFKCDLTPLSVCPGSNFKLASISPWKPLLFPGCFQARLVGFLVDGSASAVELWSPMKLSLLEVLSGRFLKIPKVENCMLKLWIVCFVFCGGSVFENVLGWRVFGMMGGSCDVFFCPISVTRKEVPFRIAQHFCYVWGWLSTHLLRSFGQEWS